MLKESEEKKKFIEQNYKIYLIKIYTQNLSIFNFLSKYSSHHKQ